MVYQMLQWCRSQMERFNTEVRGGEMDYGLLQWCRSQMERFNLAYGSSLVDANGEKMELSASMVPLSDGAVQPRHG